MTDIFRDEFKFIKNKNISLVLNYVRENGPISRADIAEAINLAPPTISRITKKLIKEKFIIQEGLGESSGGRPPVLLKLNPSAGYIIGVNLGPGILEVVLSDLEAEILVKKSKDMVKTDQDYVLENIIALINDLINASEVDKDKLFGIGVAVHGLVNSEEGISIFAPYYHWTEVAIKEILEKKLQIPVVVDNDVRAMALGESWFGITKGIDDFIMINVGNGIGSGIVINGELHYGSNYSAGELGHTVIDINGPECECGNYGCLTSLASNPKIVERTKALIRRGVETEVYDLIEGNLANLTVGIICQAARNGDEMAQQILQETGMYLGMGISYLLNILDPKMIVVVGEVTKAKEYVFATIKNILRNRALEIPVNNLKLKTSKLGINAATIGGATLVLKEILDN